MYSFSFFYFYTPLVFSATININIWTWPECWLIDLSTRFDCFFHRLKCAAVWTWIVGVMKMKGHQCLLSSQIVSPVVIFERVKKEFKLSARVTSGSNLRPSASVASSHDVCLFVHSIIRWEVLCSLECFDCVEMCSCSVHLLNARLDDVIAQLSDRTSGSRRHVAVCQWRTVVRKVGNCGPISNFPTFVAIRSRTDVSIPWQWDPTNLKIES